MKTLKSILFGLALIISFTAAKADAQPSKTEVLDIFMNASAHGKLEKFESILANNVEFTTQRGERTIKSDKNDMLAFYKASENVNQDCKCTSTTLVENEKNMLVKVQMKFENYTRTNLVTMKNIGGNWKITRVETSVANS